MCIYIYKYISLTILSKEVEKLNFRQYGQMKSRAEAERRENSEEKESEERRCRCAKR